MTIQSKPTTYTKVWAATGSKVAADDFKITRGWEVEKPPYEVMNWLQNRQDQWIAHANQRGVAQWDSNTEYKANVSYVTGPTSGIIYRATVDSTGINPETDLSGKWLKAFDESQYAYSKAQSDVITAGERATSNAAYLKVASNLADLSNLATARNNLSVYSKSETNGIAATERATSDAKYLQRANNLSDLVNTQTARANLGVYSKTETYARTETYSQVETNTLFLSKADNLASLVDKAAARSNLDVYSKSESDALTPAGMVAAFAMATAPAGWIPCDGRSLSRAAYPRLFAAIGTLYGSADANTFNVPDYRGEFLRGWDNGRGIDVGRLFGTFQADELRSHNHTFNFPNITNNSGGGGIDDAGGYGVAYSTNYSGGSETRPRNWPVLYCIRA